MTTACVEIQKKCNKYHNSKPNKRTMMATSLFGISSRRSLLWFVVVGCLICLLFCFEICSAEDSTTTTTSSCDWNDGTSFVSCNDDDDVDGMFFCCGCTCQTQRTCWPELVGMDANDAAEYLQNELEPHCDLWIVIRGYWNDLVGRCGNVVYIHKDDDTNIVTDVPKMSCPKQDTRFSDGIGHYYMDDDNYDDEDYISFLPLIFFALVTLALGYVCMGHAASCRLRRKSNNDDSGLLKDTSTSYISGE